ncbi:MAG: hypothetical protein MI923_18930 [Phycisphaerales bacterium]|nr:hypothetical protein [Phycisphaerales bacterium]
MIIRVIPRLFRFGATAVFASISLGMTAALSMWAETSSNVPFWTAFLGCLLVLIPSLGLVRVIRSCHRHRRGLCTDCCCDLRGNVNGICPECGKLIPHHPAIAEPEYAFLSPL